MEEILASIRQIISEDGEGAAKDNSEQRDAGAESAPDTDAPDADTPDSDAPDADAPDSGNEAVVSIAADADRHKQDEMTSDRLDMDERARKDLDRARYAFSGAGDHAEQDGGIAAETASSDEADDDDIGAGGTEAGGFDDPAENTADVFAAEPDEISDVKESMSMAMPAESKHPSPVPIDDDNLLSEDSDEVVHGAFSALAHTILAQNARTLEDLVSEMLQPMLKGWLDDNLPSLVERLVKEEIDRVSRGRR